MTKYRFFYRAACIVFLLNLMNSIVSYAQEPIKLSRIDGPIAIDGRIDEPVWQTVEPLHLVMHTPTFGHEPIYPTDVRIVYDDSFLYVAAMCYSPPEEIYATSFRRDLMVPSTDYFNVLLDTFNDNQTALAFSVMPTGARLDFAVSNDAQGDMNISWNAFWDAAVTIHDEGWSVEIRIPFSSLRFQDKDGRVEMGLIVSRWFAAHSSTAIYPPIPPDWGFWSFAKPSQAQKVVLEGIYSRKPVYLAPYALGGVERAFRLNEQETAYLRNDDRTYHYGLDLKYRLTNNFTLDLTLNTDFAQVEADDQEVNLTRFSLFFPEKRSFFQERASVFKFGRDEQSNQLFYSRRIGLYEGEQVPILGGLRLVGRAGVWDVGILNMQTAREKNILVHHKPFPSENFGVVRLRRQVFNPYSYAGGMITSRYSADGRYNIAYGLDGIFRMFADDYLTVSYAHTYENDMPEVLMNFDQTRIHTQWERRSLDGFGYNLNFSRSGEYYNPGMGFIFRRNYVRFGDRIFYGWFPRERSFLQRHQVNLNGDIFIRNSDGGMESWYIGPSWEGTMKSGDMFWVSANIYTDNVENGFSLPGDSEIPAGRYRFADAGASYDKFGGRVRSIFTGRAGTYYDGNRFTFSVNPSIVLSKYVQLQGFYQYIRIFFPDRNQNFIGHIGRLKIDASLNIHLSSTAFIQYNSSINAVIVNMRIRYNPREGNDLYIVWNEGMNTDRYSSDVVLPVTNGRTIILKYTHTILY
jgi:hypothetical protein